jgi:hypothetical protein
VLLGEEKLAAEEKGGGIGGVGGTEVEEIGDGGEKGDSFRQEF